MPNEHKSAMEEFLGDIPVANQQPQGAENSDILTQSLMPEASSEQGGDETVINPRDNREERRAKKALREERKANIEMAQRIEELTELVKFSRETSNDNVDEKLKQLYGSDEKGMLAAKITQDLLRQSEERGAERALEQFQAQQAQAEQEVAQFREELDEYLEDIEDEFNVDLTSDDPMAIKARQGFFSLLNEVSPKDESGSVSDFADPIATWKLFSSQNKSSNTNRAKDLGSRSMTRSGSSGNEQKLEATAQERWLNDNGILDWTRR